MPGTQPNPSPAMSALALPSVLLLFLWVVGFLPIAAWGQSGADARNLPDVEVASITVVKSQEATLTEMLGSPSCQIPSADSRTLTSVYAQPNGETLHVVVNRDPSHVYFQLVESLVMSFHPQSNQGCQGVVRPVGSRTGLSLETGKGIRLGDSLNRVIASYGAPAEQHREGHMTRLKYVQDAGIDRHLEWTLVFQGNHLTQWTVEAYPVFYEVGG